MRTPNRVAGQKMAYEAESGKARTLPANVCLCRRKGENGVTGAVSPSFNPATSLASLWVGIGADGNRAIG